MENGSLEGLTEDSSEVVSVLPAESSPTPTADLNPEPKPGELVFGGDRPNDPANYWRAASVVG